MPKNNISVCEAEFEKWLDFKKVPSLRREEKKDHQKVIVGAMVDGNLTIETGGEDSTGSFFIKYKLLFPVGDDGLVSLEIGPRINVKNRAGLKHVDPQDGDRRIATVIGALSGANSSLVMEMDTEDMDVMQAVALYFL